ncbi:MAG: sulfatase-like hydrolase/transferase [Clostridia bacterium]|nr:sulfatase-like hydrolase/transferase [Clostridia bacterium]
MKKNVKVIYYIIFLLVYLEVMFRAIVFKENFFSIRLIYLFLFSIPTVFFLNLISNIFKEKVSKILLGIISGVIIFYFLVQLIFYKMFSIPFSFSTLGLAGGALTYTDVVFDAIFKNIHYIIIFFIPLILYIIFRKRIVFERYNVKQTFLNSAVIIISFLLAMFSLNVDKKNLYSANNLYYKIDAQEKNIETFGVLTATKIDIKRVIFGFEEELILGDTVETINNIEEVVEYNISDIDFNSLIQSNEDKTLDEIYTYINSTAPTNKNEYTGYFEGKNLIFILAEGFNSIAVNKELTPTLYKLSNSGFVFNNFYSPVFLSTTGGEFQATTGLIPSQTTLNLWKEQSPTISYALGNSFSDKGYNARAFHDWTYTYYSREKTMKTLGYSEYIGIGNGLEKKIDSKWLPSDLDMIKATTENYINDEQYVTYYITVSGHAPYNFGGGNSTALRHKALVENLDYNTEVKAYLASQIELDKALEELLKQLESNGTLDNTVIALVGDHYPYVLSMDSINSISDYERDSIVEVNRSNFIIWNNQIEESIYVDKVGSQIDILPTLLNLFGIEYDSRLIIGKDILSDQEGLAIFSNRSWVSDYGTYYEATKEFIPKKGKTVEDGYVDKINTEVANKFTMSNLFIKYKIYDLLLEE